MSRIDCRLAADGTHQTSNLSPLKFKRLYRHGAKVRNPARNESVSSVCSQEVTARFTSASVAQSLATEVVLKGSKGMWINRRKASIALLPVTVLRYDTLTVFYPVCITTWKIYLCPFTRRNLRLRTVFHVGWADTLFLKLHFVWVLKVTQLWRVVRPCIASDTVCLIYTKRRASDTSALRLIAFLYYKIKRTRIPPNFIDTESSLSCSQQLTAFPYPELEKSTSLQSISYIYIYYSHLCSVLPSCLFPSDFHP